MDVAIVVFVVLVVVIAFWPFLLAAALIYAAYRLLWPRWLEYQEREAARLLLLRRQAREAAEHRQRLARAREIEALASAAMREAATWPGAGASTTLTRPR